VVVTWVVTTAEVVVVLVVPSGAEVVTEVDVVVVVFWVAEVTEVVAVLEHEASRVVTTMTTPKMSRNPLYFKLNLRFYFFGDNSN
jgi:hypothetical protein